MDSNERERRRQRRYREAMRNRAIAAVVLVALIVGAVFIVKGCKKDETLPADDRQEQQMPAHADKAVVSTDDGVYKYAHDHDHEQKARAAAGMKAGFGTDVFDRQRLAVFIAEYRLVFGAVV